MEEELNKKIDSLINVLDHDNRIIKLAEIKEKLISNQELITKITKLKELDRYSSEYKELKANLFKDSDFVSFKELESEIDFLILEINNKLNVLTNERRCNHANN